MPVKTRKIRINPADPNTTLSANTSGVVTPILTHTVPLGVERRLETGTKFRIKLLTSAGVDIPKDSWLYIAKKSPMDNLWREIYKFSYNPFHSLTLAEQLNESSYAEQLKIWLPAKAVGFRQQDQLLILLESTSVISTSLSTIEFELVEYPVAI